MGGDRITIPAFLDTTGFQKGSQQLTNAVKSMGNSVKRISSQISRTFNAMTSPIKRMVPMLLGVGSAYSIISRAVSTFMSQNMRLQAQMTAIWTALGNLLAPIITQIISWISTAVSYFIKFLNLIGVTSKTASQLSKKAQGSAGALQRTIAGFDELNVLTRPTGYQGTLEDKDLPAWLEKLTELLKNKLWDEAADLIIAKFDSIINTFKSKAYEFGEKCSEYLYGALHIIGRVIDEVDWAGIGEGLANFINGLVSDERISGEDLGKILVGKFTMAFKILTGFLETLDFGRIGEIFSGVVKGALNSLNKAIVEADFEKIGRNIRAFFENIDWAGVATSLGNLLKNAWDAAVELLKGFIMGSGDSSSGLGEDAAENISKAILIALGLGTILTKTGLAAKISSLIKKLTKVGSGTEKLNNTANVLKPKLKQLASNLAWGIVILAEIAVSASIIIASIWAIGELLQEAVEAWQPVIDNGETAEAAIEKGSIIIAAAAIASGLLGSLGGGGLAAKMGIGIGILAEIGVAAALFVAEIWAIGELLQQVLEAWQPVLANGETVQTAIVQGSILLGVVAAAAAALGAITLVTGGGLAAAIAIGAAVLYEVAEATKLFIEELTDVAKKLADELAPELEDLNEELPSLNTNMKNFKDYMEKFAGYVVSYTKSETITALCQLGSTIRNWLLGDPIENMKDEIDDVYDDIVPLREKLELVNPELAKTVGYMKSYSSYKSQIEALFNSASSDSGEGVVATLVSKWGDAVKSWFMSEPLEEMKDEADAIYEDVVPLREKLELVNPELKTTVQLLTEYSSFKSQIEALLSAGSSDGTSTGGSTLAESMFVNMKTMGEKLVAGLVEGIQSKASEFSNAAKTLANKFETSLSDGMDKVIQKFSRMADTVTTSMSQVQSTLSSSYAEMSSSTGSFLSSVYSSIGNAFTSIARNSYVWGADMIVNFTNGLASQVSNLYSACCTVAQSIRNILGFSEPKEGPLSDFHTYAPDMIDLFTKGILDNKDKALEATSELAEGISSCIQDGDYSFGTLGVSNMGDFMDGFADKVVNGFSDMVTRMQQIADQVVFSMPTVAGGGFLPYNVSSGSSSSSSSEENSQILLAIEQMQDTITRFESAVDNMQWVIKFGNVRGVVEEITKVQKQMERAKGGI